MRFIRTCNLCPIPLPVCSLSDMWLELKNNVFLCQVFWCQVFWCGMKEVQQSSARRPEGCGLVL